VKPIVSLLLLAVAFAALAGEATAPRPTDLAHDILPLIKQRCAECHTNGKYQGGLSLDDRAAIIKSKAIVIGKSARSVLLQRITATDPARRMPPVGEPLTAEQVALFKAWIDAGMPWEEGFTFKKTVYSAPLKLRTVILPPVRNGRDHPVDRLVGQYFAKHRIKPPEPLDDVAFTRRLWLDLVGLLPPSPLVGEGRDEGDRRTALIRRLLADRRAFADNWLAFWNDLLRNEYVGTGYIDGGRKAITSWLYRALLDNKSYDLFVRELISPNAESEGFIRGLKWRGRVNASQVIELQFAQNVSQVFFGINLKCASCHDSFVDHWKLADAYGLAAVVADEPLEINRCDKPTGQFARPRFVLPELGDIDAGSPKLKRLEQLASLVTSPENGRFSRTIVNRIWHRLLGRGLVHPVDAMDTAPWCEEVLDYLAGYLIDNGYDLKKLIEHICRSRTYQSKSVGRASSPTSGEDARPTRPTSDFVFRGPETKRLTAEQFMDGVYLITGAGPTAPAPPVVALFARIPELPPSLLVRATLVNSDLLMRSLGRPNREQVVTSRPEQLTTLQALDLSNGQILHDLVTRGADNLLRANQLAARSDLINELYLRALSRRPSPAELLAARELLGESVTAEGLADLLWSIFMLPEFQLVR